MTEEEINELVRASYNKANKDYLREQQRKALDVVTPRGVWKMCTRQLDKASYACSECNKVTPLVTTDEIKAMRYCPYCGAKMEVK